MRRGTEIAKNSNTRNVSGKMMLPAMAADAVGYPRDGVTAIELISRSPAKAVASQSRIRPVDRAACLPRAFHAAVRSCGIVCWTRGSGRLVQPGPHGGCVLRYQTVPCRRVPDGAYSFAEADDVGGGWFELAFQGLGRGHVLAE